MREGEFTRIVSQEALDYFKRELSREMDPFERGVLEDMTLKNNQMNRRLRQLGLGKANVQHTEQDLVQLLIDRVRVHEAAAATKKIMVGYTGGKRDAFRG
jgi:hypothetical protein